ncbi:nose resistant to fluoxetine protein 6 [Caerostris extrusa]|uniref:Nose resistant to fluoxetine protein 6 n=1 Tax=Caerostris extrusa TaxID=172846 RepID=A0AAV4Y770_CAEEX|nr:nose resistant to fluoxetine protein 6 [Caerostris extrusa]
MNEFGKTTTIKEILNMSTLRPAYAMCVQETLKLVAGIRKLKPWALRFIDSSAKSIEGLMLGSLSSIGMYDECVDTVVYSEKLRNKGELIFRGQYCSLEFKPPLPPKKGAYKLDSIMPELQPFFDNKSLMAEGAKYAQAFYFISIRIGVCVPSGCTEDDINQVAELVGEQLGVDGEVATCEVKKETEYTSLNILSFCAFGTIAAIVLIGSSIDIYSYYTKTVFNHIVIRVLLAFSFVTNFKKFSNTKIIFSKFEMLKWNSVPQYDMVGLEPLKIYAKDFMFQAILNATYSVDSFFVMGGLLNMEDSSSFNLRNISNISKQLIW